jgi:formiminotetrahydrofolate cyclodeaminase
MKGFEEMGDFIEGEVDLSMSVAGYIEAVRTRSLPGGGSVAALTGALAAALIGKVCRLTLGRPEFAAYEERTAEIDMAAARLEKEFEDLMVKDAAAYREVVMTYRLPKSTDDENDLRRAALEAAWKKAAEAPLRIAELSREVVGLGRALIGRSNRTTTADIGIAANLAYGAVEGAIIVVKDNLVKIKDRPWADEVLARAEKMAADAASDWEDIRYEVNELCACTL